MVAQIDKAYMKARPYKLYSRLLSYGLFEGRPLTTKGRWINPLLFRLFNVAMTMPPLKRVNSPVFIIGTGRSGTTILGMLMSMHRDVGFLNEPKALWHAAFKHEDLIGSYTREPARYRLNENDATLEVKNSMHRLYGSYLFFTGSRRVVDKYPELIFRVPFVRAIFPDAKFIFLARNGWDTCHSIDTWSQRLGVTEGTEIHDWWGVDQRKWNLLCEQLIPEDPELSSMYKEIIAMKRHTDMAAIEWILTMREGIRLRQTLPDAVHTVIYEDLIQTPRKTLGNLLDFCGLSTDPVFMRYAEETLHVAPQKAPYELAPILRPAFNSTMMALGYSQ